VIKRFISLLDGIKEKIDSVFTVPGLACLLLAAGFWGMAFPRYMFTGDCVRITDDEGGDITEEAEEDRNLFVEIGSAGSDQIRIKFSFLE